MTYQPDEIPEDPELEAEPESEPLEEAEAQPQQPDRGAEPAPDHGAELRGLKYALSEERRRARELAERDQRRGQEFAVLQDRLGQLSSLVQQGQQPKVEAPDQEQDPVGWMRYQVDQQQGLNRQVQDYIKARQQEVQHTQQQGQMMQAVQAREYEFLQQQPDYHEALTHLRRELIGDLTTQGFAPQIAMQIVHQQELAVAANALQMGENPAARLYQAAQRRGYGSNGYGGGSDGEVGPEIEALAQQLLAAGNWDSGAETGGGYDLSTLAAGQEESATLGSIGSSGRGGAKLTLDSLAKMSKEDFAAATAGDNWRKLMGA